ncbi:hypothetical protein C7974DRAFT_135558 [Boeremia exigua]|uniref:uncharacterized protein n=1 Tax=Boeremia exigua TaxID=749465 RepID=UPI001E8E9EB7|nr:uncharacterized protein C7974DRAFT_135558 [Boeremia exigua]KAH6639623.1 hypothetical protein C7974DRAFT_135558 [Boeremia exigua]
MATSTTDGEKKPFRVEAAARGGIVTIVAGSEAVKYLVHKAVLMEHSAYFEKALQGPWKEAEEGVVRLDDVEPEIFGVFVDWIYSQRVSQLGLETEYLGISYRKHFQMTWLKACILGDRLLAPMFVQAFRYDLVHHLVNHQSVLYDTIIYGFSNLAAGDPLLRMVTDVHIYDIVEGSAHDDQELRMYLPMRFLLAIKDKFAIVLDTQEDVCNLDTCDYHGHTSEEERKKCKKRLEDSRRECC